MAGEVGQNQKMVYLIVQTDYCGSAWIWAFSTPEKRDVAFSEIKYPDQFWKEDKLLDEGPGT